MFAFTSLLSLLYIAPRVFSIPVDATCAAITPGPPSSSVFYPGSPEYIDVMVHSSTAKDSHPACIVQPAAHGDLAKILEGISAKEPPFAVEDSGHGSNRGSSSTTNVHTRSPSTTRVQISMKKFSQINYDSQRNVVTIGAGLVWDDVYAALDPLGVGVFGERVAGAGVARFLLGGGHSSKTDQYGLAVDNIVAINVVLYNGTSVTTTKDDHGDLFWALKGGSNNVGIATSFVLKTHPQVGDLSQKIA